MLLPRALRGRPEVEAAAAAADVAAAAADAAAAAETGICWGKYPWKWDNSLIKWNCQAGRNNPWRSWTDHLKYFKIGLKYLECNIIIMLITIIKHNNSRKLSITTVCFESFRVGVGLHIIWYSILNSIWHSIWAVCTTVHLAFYLTGCLWFCPTFILTF